MNENSPIHTAGGSVPMAPLAPADRLMNESETAEFLGVAIRTLQDWRVRGSKLRFVKIGSLVRYRLSDVDAFIASNTRTSTSEVA